MRAHPRSRGENTATLIRADDKKGSSPLTRGKLKAPAHDHHRLGLIPAHAGKTVRTVRRVRSPWAHPRSRGENALVIGVLKARGGSSPLTRGKLPGPRAGVTMGGLIPAHAGKTANL